MTEERVPLNRLTLVRFGRAVLNFTSSEVGWKARSLFALLIAFLFAINGLNVLNSYVARDFMTAIAGRDHAGFVRQAVLYLAVFAASTMAATLYRFSEERLALLWRRWLTGRILTGYLDERVYYRLEARGELPNADQRIADDVRAFTVTTLSFVLMVLNATFTVVAFAGVLWSISVLLFGVAVGYAALGSLLTIVLGRPLVWLNYNQSDHEANFRSGLIHLRQNAESVALLRREGRLGARLRQHLDALTGNWRRIIGVNRNLTFFTTGYNYLIQIIPALIIAPLFMRGEVEFGVIAQSAMAFSLLLGAFSLIVTQFQSISSFAAVVARLSALAEAVEQVHAAPSGIETAIDDQRVAYEHLTLRSPRDGRVLLEALSACVPFGTRLLVQGAEAARLALFRATAGLWDTGEGRVIRPGIDDILFLPERPYLPPGTLREALVRTGREARVADAEILATLRALDIEELVGRAGGLDVEKDWDDVLSLAEQQQLAVARLLLAAPRFVLLDRPATALGERVPKVLSTLKERGITCVAVAEPGLSLEAFDAALDLADDGTWNWRALPRSAAAG